MAVAALATAAAVLGRAPAAARAVDHVRRMQMDAEATGTAPWGHWGDQPARYVAWSNHSNRLIPV